MQPLIEGPYLGDWLKWETDNLHSRDAIVLLAGSDCVTGTVLGRVTGSGAYTALDPDGSDGTQDAAGILVGNVIAESDGDAPGVAIVRDANINPGALVWPAGIPQQEQADALAALAAQGIVAREEA